MGREILRITNVVEKEWDVKEIKEIADLTGCKNIRVEENLTKCNFTIKADFTSRFGAELFKKHVARYMDYKKMLYK